MATNKINDGVGKKIVEALRMQTSDVTEAENEQLSNQDSLVSDESQPVLLPESDETFDSNNNLSFEQPQDIQQPASDLQLKIQAQLQEQAQQAQFDSVVNSSFNPGFVDNAFQQSLVQNLGNAAFSSIQDDFNYPANVAVIKQLIAKLPAGVSRQTGALIIRQTMEALGIPMHSVLQEAKQVQETLKSNTRECQNNITEYRKQISILEAKSQQYQTQYAVMNDIINLFLQTGAK